MAAALLRRLCPLGLRKSIQICLLMFRGTSRIELILAVKLETHASMRKKLCDICSPGQEFDR